MRASAIVAGAALVATASAAHAVVFKIGPFPLQGVQEVPPVVTPATGEATLFIDNMSGAFTLEYEFSGLTSNVTLAHFHNAPAGTNGGVIYWLAAAGAPDNDPGTLMSPPLPTGVTSAMDSGTGVFPAASLSELFAGNIYVNIHTEQFGGGEIRGQVVPAPGALAPLACAGLLGLHRRRRP